MKNKTVFVGLSGGVDSSVAAALLIERGFKVVGVHLKCWNIDGCADQDAEDARRAAEILKIPFYVFDFEKEYKAKVVEYMVSGYKRGITPNPDVMCNHEIKFGLFFKKAMQLGADFVATGHYARTKAGKLFSGVDKNKDQSYFLWMLSKKELDRTIFPVGELEKSEVRKIAQKFNLENADKKDSQGVCFLGEIKLPEFLGKFIEMREGEIISESGAVVGKHKGVEQFTIGQRRGLGASGLKKPHFVAEKNIKTGKVLIVPEGDERLYKKTIELTDVNILDNSLKFPQKVSARIRYRQKLERDTLRKEKDRLILDFDQPQKFVASGQSAVFYDLKRKELFGGGVIKG